MGRMVLAIFLFTITLIASIFLFIWVRGSYFPSWFEEWLLLGAITFLLGSGIVLSAMIFERAIRDRDYGR